MLNLAAFVLVLCVGWVWAGNSGAALGLLWWRTPAFASVWLRKPGLFESSLPGSTPCWISPWLMVRPPLSYRMADKLADGSRPPSLTAPALEMICRDEVDAVEFARMRREWLGRAD